ncbi:hypothetical protein PUNSTDRAFT_95736 [Punctularia strigosozonata HHB-11173 SS5]|uniref:uncharacterized protein n=1 Tax=Punctularia strigosozonata (strain HHB-11173) TaxID=741275 RepID=UPI0004417DC8|nr:uncharacterized protein PUNSTDRAFT_95736 [Punctularia strigosozonata HHB-11173 SS5]EIN14136.1 hypothetical protein PUNSTDRAFT_95736 [Punctularia strigosozonata HHB-11173 SS5]
MVNNGDFPAENTQSDSAAEDRQEKQCRICLDGEDPLLGRLIRPCLCKGSITYVHVKCLQTWRMSSQSETAFFKCPQCGYRYRFARTRIVGMASNPVIIAAGSAILFTVLVLCSSFITTAFLSPFEDDIDTRHSGTTYYYSSYGGFWTSPWDVGRDLIRAFLRILRDEPGIIDKTTLSSVRARSRAGSPPGLVWRLITRFLLGLPVVGAVSVVQLLLSMQLLGPVHWIARYRGNRRRGDNRDVAALIVLALLIAGAARALYQVYRWTERWTKRLLLRAEDAILEVNT